MSMLLAPVRDGAGRGGDRRRPAETAAPAEQAAKAAGGAA
jgi:hypothetical protein